MSEPVSNADELEATIRQLRTVEAERDAARRDACRNHLYVRMGIHTAKEIADRRGWDCFKEGTEQC